MPQMNGLELTAWVRSHPELYNIPIIMVTSRSQQKHKSEAEQVGVTDYITKPFDTNTLHKMIANCLNIPGESIA